MNNELYHHGIKGMHWGIRRFQNEDGSLTPAGRERYGVDIEGKTADAEKAQKDYEQALEAFNTLPNTKNERKLNKAGERLKLANRLVKDEHIKEKLNAETKDKSKRRLSLEEEYKSKGMNDEEAAVAAYKREHTEKMLKIAAGVTLAAAVSYVAYKNYDKVFDTILPEGTIIQNISEDNEFSIANRGVSDAFYAAYKGSDQTKYLGMYGGGQLGGINGRPGNIFDAMLGRTDGTPRDILKTRLKVGEGGAKIASQNKANSAIQDLWNNDSEYRKAAKDAVSLLGQDIMTSPKGKLSKRELDMINQALVAHTPAGETASRKLYQKLKTMGYDGLLDINDKKYSGYNAKKPVIIFNAAEKMTIDSVKKANISEMKEAKKKAENMLYRDVVGKMLLTEIGAYGTAIGVGVGVTNSAQNAARDKIVDDYRKKHPNSQLSYNEILNNYYSN